MPRASKIKKITTSDTRAFTALSKVGYLKPEHFKELHISDKRLNQYQKEGLLDNKTYYNQREGKVETSYYLTSKGQKYVSQNLAIKTFYHSNSASHDSKLADKYFSLTQEERDTWVSEVDLRLAYPELNPSQGYSPTDAQYTATTGTTTCVEVVTQNYSKEMIQQKIDFTTQINAQHEFIRA